LWPQSLALGNNFNNYSLYSQILSSVPHKWCSSHLRIVSKFSLFFIGMIFDSQFSLFGMRATHVSITTFEFHVEEWKVKNAQIFDNKRLRKPNSKSRKNDCVTRCGFMVSRNLKIGETILIPYTVCFVNTKLLFHFCVASVLGGIVCTGANGRMVSYA